MKRLLLSLNDQAWGFYRLRKFNPFLLCLGVALCTLFGIRRQFSVRMHGHQITIRSATPDAAVAFESLGREWRPVVETFVERKGGLIIDAGGYIGTAAVRLASTYKNCTVVCIEPSSDNLAILRQNVAAFPNIAVIHGALAALPGELLLRDPGRKHWGFTVLDEGSSNDANGVERVPAITIGDILRQQGASSIFILKLDIEGAERDVLLHSDDWMPSTEVMIAELHEHIAPGVNAAYSAATKGRFNIELSGEKVLSVQAGLTR